jgi:thymidine kinase
MRSSGARSTASCSTRPSSLTRTQVIELAAICDELDIPVLAYGLRTDFQGQLFEGSGALLALADTWSN